MSIGTYAQLQTSLADWLHRTGLTSQIVDFIALAESEINTDIRMRLMEVDQTLTLAASATTVALPARFSEPIFLELVISGQENVRLKYRTPQDMRTQVGAGEPTEWTVNGANIEFSYPANQVYTLRFRMLQDFDIATTSTNALLTKYPGIYLYGALLQAAPYMVNDKRIATWERMYEKLMNKANKNEGRVRAKSTMTSDAVGVGSRTNIIRGY